MPQVSGVLRLPDYTLLWGLITEGNKDQDKPIYSSLLDADRAGEYPVAMGSRELQAAKGVGGIGAAPSLCSSCALGGGASSAAKTPFRWLMYSWMPRPSMLCTNQIALKRPGSSV